MAKVIFAMLDADDSGELEPEELLIFDRRVVGASRDVKAAKDAQDQFWEIIKQAKLFFKSTFGLD